MPGSKANPGLKPENQSWRRLYLLLLKIGIREWPTVSEAWGGGGRRRRGWIGLYGMRLSGQRREASLYPTGHCKATAAANFAPTPPHGTLPPNSGVICLVKHVDQPQLPSIQMVKGW